VHGLSLLKNFAVGYVLPVATFGENLKRKRKDAGLKAKDLAEALEPEAKGRVRRVIISEYLHAVSLSARNSCH